MPEVFWGAITWQQVYAFLTAVFSVHLAVFLFLALRRKAARYKPLAGTFLFLTAMYAARSMELGSPEFFLTCRVLAAACTSAYVAGWVRNRAR
ncbi:MAG: hypothetical protein HY319_04735 [Armatimonadetes bacterium]|nr:hypothetical protein [Armatimonadota bacterium]